MTDLHVRHQLRAAVAAALDAAGIVGADNVFPARSRPTTDAQLPCLLVFTEDEAGERFTGDSTQRTVELVIRGRLKAVGDPPQDALDALAVGIERAIAGAGNFGRLVFDLQYRRTHTGVSSNSDRQAGDIDVTYDVTINTANNDPAKSI
jgi:hypothetical protein